MLHLQCATLPNLPLIDEFECRTKSGFYIPNITLCLDAWRYQHPLEILEVLLGSRKPSTKVDCSRRWSVFSTWYSSNSLDLRQPIFYSLRSVSLVRNECGVCTIKGYSAAIATCLFFSRSRFSLTISNKVYLILIIKFEDLVFGYWYLQLDFWGVC